MTIERKREFVISVQLIIYAKQNGVKYTTISATGTMAQIGWRRRRLLLGHGDEVGELRNQLHSSQYRQFILHMLFICESTPLSILNISPKQMKLWEISITMDHRTDNEELLTKMHSFIIIDFIESENIMYFGKKFSHRP